MERRSIYRRKVGMSILISALCFTSCEVLQEVINESNNLNLESLQIQSVTDNLLRSFDKKSPITTSFNDAVYEVEALHDFEPNEYEYLPLDIQPKLNSRGYIFKSGLYTMNAKSFCLRSGTHGPSRGDGHLYAPLKGKRAGLVQQILHRYGNKAQIQQNNIQILLWAIVAGADMNTLGEQHTKTLNELFTIQELLEYEGRDWLTGFADTQLKEFKLLALNTATPHIQKLINTDNKIRAMVKQNKSFQEIEKIAILAGVAPKEHMIRKVSKGRWSYHQDGYFIRFFPNGYQQTRVDIYVPFEGDFSFDSTSKSRFMKNNSPKVQEVVYNPSIMVASPANQSSQRIGLSSLPVDDINCLNSFLSSYEHLGIDGEFVNLKAEVDCNKRKVNWVTDNLIADHKPSLGGGKKIVEYGNQYNVNSSHYHCYYVENTICDKSKCADCTEENVFNTMLKSASYAAPSDSKLPIKNYSITNVNIPCVFNNPIMTTIHPLENAIINYTLVTSSPSNTHKDGVATQKINRHFLHPGKVQRKIFSEGTKIKVATMGEGTTWFTSVNLVYANRTWLSVDNRLKNAFGCK